jgi:hypothetical protein
LDRAVIFVYRCYYNSVLNQQYCTLYRGLSSILIAYSLAKSMKVEAVNGEMEVIGERVWTVVWRL